MCRVAARSLLFGALIAFASLAFADRSFGQPVTYQGVDLFTVRGLANSVDGSFDVGTGYPQSAFGGQVIGGNTGHALLWDHNGTPTDLHPAALGFSYSVTNGTNGQQQVGVAFSNGSSVHAMLWNGTAASAVDLNPSGYGSSYAYGTNGTQQVGVGAGNIENAILWNGSAQSAVRLANSVSAAFGTNGTHQVGNAEAEDSRQHAMLWSGTPDSAVDLNGQFLSSNAWAISPDGTQQVGSAYGPSTGGNTHAVLWRGSAASVVDLTPEASVIVANAFATNGKQQAGAVYGNDTAGKLHAAVWSGTADSMIDLQPLLPSNLVSSRATGIDGDGNIYGLAVDTAGNPHAVEWIPVPEPTALANLALVATLFPRRRRLDPARH
jgi:hypothetical protein